LLGKSGLLLRYLQRRRCPEAGVPKVAAPVCGNFGSLLFYRQSRACPEAGSCGPNIAATLCGNFGSLLCYRQLRRCPEAGSCGPRVGLLLRYLQHADALLLLETLELFVRILLFECPLAGQSSIAGLAGGLRRVANRFLVRAIVFHFLRVISHSYGLPHHALRG